MFWTWRETRAEVAGKYATRQDFCRIFESEMDRLYLLAVLLTGDPRRAEQCFTDALDACSQSHRVFNGWEQNWAVFSIIKCAIRMVRPTQSATSVQSLEPRPHPASEFQAVVNAVCELPTLERFVFVMSVLEKYSDRECSAFLHCALSEMAPARERACRQLGSALQGLVPHEWRARASA